MDKEKLNDIICESSSDYDILNNAYTYIESLEQRVKKQKEVIDKAIELRNNFAKENAGLIFENDKLIKFMNNLLDLLNEVSK